MSNKPYTQNDVNFTCVVPTKDGLFGAMEKKYHLVIQNDEDPINPMGDWDMLGKFYTAHRNYKLGHFNGRSSEDVEREMWKDGLLVPQGVPQAALDADEFHPDYGCTGAHQDTEWNGKWEPASGAILLPLALFDHSGIRLYVGEKTCRWDSMRVGWVGMTVTDAREQFMLPDAPEADMRERAEKGMNAEVETVSDYLEGNCWGFILEELDEDDNVVESDSCWGFLGQIDSEDSCGIFDALGSKELSTAARHACDLYTSAEIRETALEELKVRRYAHIDLLCATIGKPRKFDDKAQTYLISRDQLFLAGEIKDEFRVFPPEGFYFLRSCGGHQNGFVYYLAKAGLTIDQELAVPTWHTDELGTNTDDAVQEDKKTGEIFAEWRGERHVLMRVPCDYENNLKPKLVRA